MNLNEQYNIEIDETKKQVLNRYIPRIEEASAKARSKAKLYIVK